MLAGLLGACRGGGEPPATGSGGTVAGKPRPLVVIGIDGATWDLIDPMMAAGELPNFRKLVERGTRSELVALLPLSSPVVWTTYATGRFARHHMILDHTYPFVKGPKRRVRSIQRRVPALWTVASHHGRKVVVVGYFASHPPEEVNGVMISDRAAKGAHDGVFPAELWTELQPELDRLADAEEIRSLRQRYLPWPYDETAIHRPEDTYFRATKTVKGRIATHLIWEEFIKRSALHLAAREFDLFMVYLRMIDHASHSTWIHFDDSEFEVKVDAVEQDLLKDVIPTAYRETDEYLGQLLAELGDEVNVVLVSDHGFGPSAGDWAPQYSPQDLTYVSGAHRPNGVFIAAGPDIPHGEIEGITTLDVAPTLLALLRLPISSELPGQWFEDLFRPGFLAHPPERGAPYRMRWKVLPESEAVSDEAEAQDLKILSSLGYLNADATVASGEDGKLLDFWSTEPRLYRSAIIGEGMFHLMRDDLKSIEDLRAITREHDPVLARDLLLVLRRRMSLWQTQFDFPLLSEATREKLESE